VVAIIGPDLRTLQLGPLWVLSALAGTHANFRPYELEAFWDSLVAVTLRTSPPAQDILRSTAADRLRLVADFTRDDRPVVSGLRHIVAILDRGPEDLAESYKVALLRIGMEVGRSRGPYGRSLTPEDEQMLLLLAELLEMDSDSALIAGVLV
jgi:hypothetical protein